MSENSTYWKANKPTSLKITELLEKDDQVIAAALAFAARFPGADKKAVYYHRYPFGGDLHVSGIIFRDASQVDQKLFKRLKGSENGWQPRCSSKASREIHAEFSKLRCNSSDAIMELCKIPHFTPGMNSVMIGVRAVKPNVVYIAIPMATKSLEGCTRVSDLEFEKASRVKVTVSAERSRKATTKKAVNAQRART